MAYVKAAVKDRMREEISRIDGVYSCWIERCIQRKDGTYDLDIRFSDFEGITFAILEKVSQIFRTTAINVDGGYEEGCPTCGGFSYVEVNVMGGTFSI